MDPSSMNTVVDVWLSVGSNLGDRLSNLQAAVDLVDRQAGMVQRVSSVYESPAWGYDSPHPFLNACMQLQTRLKPEELMILLLAVEERMGRRRSGAGYADRRMDLDILFYGDRIVRESGIEIPHPRLADRRFVLVPLTEIAPDLRHPANGLRVGTLLEQCMDTGPVRKVTATLRLRN